MVLGVGGGAVQLKNIENAAGVRWMLVELGKKLDAADVPHQFASVAPAVNGSAGRQADGEQWARAFLEERLELLARLGVVATQQPLAGVF